MTKLVVYNDETHHSREFGHRGAKHSSQSPQLEGDYESIIIIMRDKIL